MKNSKNEIARIVSLLRMPKYLAEKFLHGYLETEDIIHIMVLAEQNYQKAHGMNYYC